MSRYRRVKRRVGDGSFVWAWEDLDKVTRIPDEYLKTAFYMSEPITEQAKATGFAVSLKCNEYPDFTHQYAVTNRHVVQDDSKGNPTPRSTSITLNTLSGRKQPVSYMLQDWHISDSDDIAVLPLMHDLSNRKYDFRTVPFNLFLTEERAKFHDFGVGDQIFYVGRFSKHEGDKINTPIMRFGRVSLYPETTVKGQRCILIEGLAVHGFSGSPVFAYKTGKPFIELEKLFEDEKEESDEDILKLAFAIQLLGVLKGGWIEPPDITEKYNPFNYGILTVIPAWHIKKFILEDEGLKKIRKNEHKIFKKAAKSGEGHIDFSEPPTKEEYMQALKKVSQKINPSDSDQPKPKS